MASPQIIRSYLVALGWNVNQTEFRKFQDALKQATGLVDSMAGQTAKRVAEVGATIIAMYGAVGAATIGLLQRTAEADLGYRMFARRMYMNEDAAKRLKIALDSLGVSQEEVVWGPPEIARRFKTLMGDQKALQGALGPDFKGGMEQLRDYEFEFTRLGTNLRYLLQSIALDVAQAFGGEMKDFFAWLQNVNRYLIEHLPEITRDIDSYLVPVLRDALAIFKDLAAMARDFFSMFSQTGDAADGFRNILKIVREISFAIRAWFDGLEYSLRLIADTARMAGAIQRNDFGSALKAYDDLKSHAVDRAGDIAQGWDGRNKQTVNAPATDMRSAAKVISTATGIPADWVYGQMAFETGKFTSPLFKQHHNIAGIKWPGSNEFRDFSSYEDSVLEMIRILNLPRYAGARRAGDLSGYIAGLGAGGYYGRDNQADYLRGVGRYAPLYYSPGPTTIQVNVPQGSNATAVDIARETWKKFQENQDAQAKRHILQLQSAYK